MLKLRKKIKSLLKKKIQATYHKIFTYIVIVNAGYAEPVLAKLKDEGSNSQIILMGKGTAKQEVMHMFGLEDNSKDVILSFVDDSNIESVQKTLEKTFAENKKIMGFAFALKFNSIVGEKIYHFLTNTL